MKPRDLLVPPRRLRPLPGRPFAWAERPVLAHARSEDRLPLEQLAATLRAEAGVAARVEAGAAGAADVRIRRDASVKDAEGYRLRVDARGVAIEAAAGAGAYYAVQTLRDLVRLHGRRLPALAIEDAPDFPRRGVYLDCSRGKVPTVATLRALVEYLARCKVNELQLYIENVFAFRAHPDIGRGFSPFEPAELLELQDHARRHHVRLVPSLTSFGHFEKILGLPAYRALGEKPGHFGLPGGTTLCPLDPRSIRLVADLYGEFLPLFDAADFNACGDEPWELGKGRSERRAARVGVGRVYLDFIRRLHALCVRHGKRMNLWSDIVLNHPEMIPELPRDLVMLNWDYHPGGKRIPRTREFAAANLAFMVCPGTNDWQCHGTRLQTAIDNVAVFVREARRWGAEGVLNTDWGDCGHRQPLGASAHGFAHGAAHAWNGRAVDDARFTDVYARLVLGDRGGRAAAYVRTLGASQDRAGASLYRLFEAPVKEGADAFRGIPRISPVWVPAPHRHLDPSKVSVGGLRRVVADLDRAPGLPAAAGEAARGFGAWIREDLAVAALLDVASARRALLVRAVRAGRTPPRAEWRAADAALRAAARALGANWLARNKPSRLADNLRFLENVRAEAAAAAGARA